MHRLAVIEPDGAAFQVAGPLDSYNEALAALAAADAAHDALMARINAARPHLINAQQALG